MKIPLEFSQGCIILNSIITSPSYHMGLGRVVFIVDTGSPKSFLGENDALRLGIPLSSLKFNEHIKMASSTYELLIGKSVKFNFKTDENKTFTVTIPSVIVAKTADKTDKSKQESKSIPSLLGTNFLIENKLSLFFAPHKDVAYLELD